MAKIAVGQFCAKASMLHNLSEVQKLITLAKEAGAKALFLPEASDYIASSASESVSLAKSVQDSEFVQGVISAGKDANLAINVGVHEPGNAAGKLKNTSLWIENGEIRQRYQKMHLFDVDIKDGPRLKESESVEKGALILPPFDTAVGKVGLTICFDLRFPEISLALRRQGAQLITYPSAFTVPTGRAHWEILLRSRAIETQSYVVAAAQIGEHNERRVSYGHSIIIDPWGQVLAEIKDEDKEPRIAIVDIDLQYVEKVRREVPLIRRTDIYPKV